MKIAYHPHHLFSPQKKTKTKIIIARSTKKCEGGQNDKKTHLPKKTGNLF